MRRASWTEDGIEVAEGELPALKPGWARFRVEACGICGSDLHAWHGKTPRRAGLTPGHEFVGTLIDSTELMADKRYVASPFSTCGRCTHCVSGNPQRCGARVIIGVMANGGIAEQVDVPASNLVEVPDTLDPLLASMTEPVAVAVRAVNLGDPDSSSRVLVIGAGTIGLSSALLAASRSAQVAVVARYPHQIELVKRFGATPITETDADAWMKEFEPDVILETIGGAVELNPLLHVARQGARIVMVGLPDEKSVNLRLVMMKEISIIGSMAYACGRRGSEFSAGLTFVGQHPDEIGSLQTHQYRLDDVREAFVGSDDKSKGIIKTTVLL